jgi:hypothetical protein
LTLASLDGETCVEAFLMDLGFGPNKRLGGFIVGIDESIDVLSKLFNRCEGCAVQGLAFQDREPDFDLVGVEVWS